MSPFSPSRKYISDRRAHVRRRTGSPAYIEPGEGNRALVLSISEGGLALHADRPLTEDPTLRMRFLLPESKSWVQTNGRIAWVSESKKEAGIRFIDLPEDARNTIQKWVLLESLQEQSGKLSEGWLGYTPNLPAEESAYIYGTARSSENCSGIRFHGNHRPVY